MNYADIVIRWQATPVRIRDNRWRQANCFADTRHYWKLSKHIFRYGHVAREDHYNGAHTVNEGAHLLLAP